MESLLCVLSCSVMSNLLQADSLPSEPPGEFITTPNYLLLPCKKRLQPCSVSPWETILIHFPPTFPPWSILRFNSIFICTKLPSITLASDLAEEHRTGSTICQQGSVKCSSSMGHQITQLPGDSSSARCDIPGTGRTHSHPTGANISFKTSEA